MDGVKANLTGLEITRLEALLFSCLLPGCGPHPLERAGVINAARHLASKVFVPQRHVVPIIRIQREKRVRDKRV